jgi:hypothetical protein
LKKCIEQKIAKIAKEEMTREIREMEKIWGYQETRSLPNP